MKIVDLHEDFAYSNQIGVDVINGDRQSSIKMLKDFDALIFSSIFPYYKVGFSLETLLDQIKFYYSLERQDYVKIIKKKEDLQSDGLKFLLSLEGLDALRSHEDLYILKELHVLSIGLTWNYDNKFASSCFTKKDYGLTSEGEEVVKLANKLGIIIDLAHASKRTVLDVTALTKKPVIVSHTNVKRLKDHKRNLDDEEIEAIVKTNGVIGISAIVPTLKEGNIQGVIESIKYIGESFGWDYVALGTDFLGIEEVPEGFENVMKIRELAKAIEGYEEKVLWKNAYRVLQEVL